MLFKTIFKGIKNNNIPDDIGKVFPNSRSNMRDFLLKNVIPFSCIL